MDGIIIINKQKGYTSHDVVAKVKKILKCKKVGHTGTLDPEATGVLPILLDEATKISKYLIEHDKEYDVVLKLGIKTDTLDSEGNIIEEDKDYKIESKEKVEEALKKQIGLNEQIPPMYSAIKVNGKKLYEYARNGEKVEIPSRQIEIYDIQLKEINEEQNEISFNVKCSKGTYIRTLCEQIAANLDTIGYMKELNRVTVGRFNIKDSITIEELEKIGKEESNDKKNEKIQEKLLTIQEIFKEKENIIIEENRLPYFLNGVKITVKKEDGVYNIYNESNKYLGLGILENNLLKRDIII